MRKLISIKKKNQTKKGYRPALIHNFPPNPSMQGKSHHHSTEMTIPQHSSINGHTSTTSPGITEIITLTALVTVNCTDSGVKEPPSRSSNSPSLILFSTSGSSVSVKSGIVNVSVPSSHTLPAQSMHQMHFSAKTFIVHILVGPSYCITLHLTPIQKSQLCNCSTIHMLYYEFGSDFISSGWR